MIHRAGGLAVEMCDRMTPAAALSGATARDGTLRWVSLLRVDTENYLDGQILISSEIQLTLDGSTPWDPGGGVALYAQPENWMYTEIRVVVHHGMTPHVWFEGAAGSYDAVATGGPDKSPGPICLPFLLGEVPDTIEVFGRATNPIGHSIVLTPGEIFTATALSRFRT